MKSWTAVAPSMRSFTSAGRLSYAAAMSAHRVSPPTGGTSRNCSTAPSAGRVRKVTSVCQMFSKVGVAPEPLSKRTTSSLVPAASRGLVSNSPQWRANPRCRSG